MTGEAPHDQWKTMSSQMVMDKSMGTGRKQTAVFALFVSRRLEPTPSPGQVATMVFFLIETRQKNPYNSDKTLLAIGWIRLETNTCCTLLLDITPMSHSVDGLAMQQKMTSWCKNRGNSAPPTRKVPRL